MIWAAVKQLAGLLANTEQYVSLYPLLGQWMAGSHSEKPLNMYSHTQIHD